MKKSSIILLLIAAGAVISLSGLYSMEFMRINTRFALFVSEIRQYGLGLFPSIYGKPYTDYPVMLTALMYLSSLGGTHLNMLTATVPNALAGITVLIFTFLLGERVRHHLGIYGAGMCLLSFEFLNIMRNPGPDMPVAAVTVAAVFAAYTAIRGDGRKRLIWLPFLLLLGYAFRGPLGVVIPAAAVVAVYAARGYWRLSAVWLVCGGLALAACLELTLWGCCQTGGKELAWLFLTDQIFGRIDKVQPPWYYFTSAVGSFALTYPLAIITVAFYARKIFTQPQDRDGEDPVFLRLLAYWALLILVGMSIPGSKHLRYITAAIPAMGLLASWIFINPNKLIAFELLRRLFFLAARYLPFFSLAGIIVSGLVLSLAQVEIGLPIVLPSLILAALCALVLRGRQERSSEIRAFYYLTVAIGCMAVAKIMIVEPVENFRETSREFAVKLDLLRGDNEVRFYRFGPDSDELKYLVNIPPERRFTGKYIQDGTPALQPSVPAPFLPPESNRNFQQRLICGLLAQFPDSPSGCYRPIRPKFATEYGYEALLQAPEGTLFLTRKKRFEEIPDSYRKQFEMVLSGSLGRNDCVVFRVKKEKN